MNKATITLTIEEELLDALEFSLKKENSSVQQRMEESLKQLYLETVPEPVREYLESKLAPPAKEKSRRASKAVSAKQSIPAPDVQPPSTTTYETGGHQE